MSNNVISIIIWSPIVVLRIDLSIASAYDPDRKAKLDEDMRRVRSVQQTSYRRTSALKGGKQFQRGFLFFDIFVLDMVDVCGCQIILRRTFSIIDVADNRIKETIIDTDHYSDYDCG